MIRITLACAGKLKENYLREAEQEFTKRLGAYCQLEIRCINEEKMPDNPSPAVKEQVLAGGALAMNIAGSGPSVFALASNYEAAVRISGEMKRHFEGLGIGCNSYAGRVSNAGARVVE